MDVHTLDDHPGGWHHDSDSRRAPNTARNLMPGSETVGTTSTLSTITRGVGTMITTRGGVGTPIEKAGARFW